MERKMFLVFLVVCMLGTQVAFAAIQELPKDLCDELHRSNPSLPCVGSPEDIAALQLKSTPLGYLENHTCKGTALACLDPQFAVLIQRFYQAGEEAGKQQGWQMPHLTDGWRSPEKQAAALASGASGVGPCGSPHNYGIAVDFNDPDLRHGLSPAMKWMRANAHLYGLETIGSASDGCMGRLCDPAHFQIQGWKNRSVARGQCITSCNAPPRGNIQSCSGGGGGGGIMSSLGNAFSQMTQPLSNLFRSHPTQPPPMANLPAMNNSVADTFGTSTFPTTNTNTNTNTSSNIQTTNSTVSTDKPQTPEEQLAQIAVGPPQTTAGSTTPQHPLTDEEFRRLQEQRAYLAQNIPTGNTLETPAGIQPFAVPFAGFMATENLNGEPSDAFLGYYIQTLTRVALAIAEILRIMRGDPQYDEYNPLWLTE